jgi:hypothetical protein
MFNALVISWFLTLGYVPQMNVNLGNQYQVLNSEQIATVAEIGVKADYHMFSVYGSMENYQYKQKDNFGFSPFRIDYTFGCSLAINSHVKLIFEHECDHSVNSLANNKSDSSYGSAYTVVKVEFSGSTK